LPLRTGAMHMELFAALRYAQVPKETYIRGKRDLVYRQKRLTIFFFRTGAMHMALFAALNVHS